MPFYLGNAGASVQLPYAIRPHDPTLVRPASVKQTIGGGQVVGRPPGPGRRTYQVVFNWLAAEDLTVLEEFYAGARGPGPFALLDPGRRNKLTANQASTGAVGGDTTGFEVDATEQVSLSTELLIGAGLSTLRWDLPVTVTSGVLALPAPTGLVGVPAPAGQAWTFSAQLAGTGADPFVSVMAALQWLDPTGMVVATTFGAPVSVLPGAWTQVAVSVAGPSGAAVQPALVVDPTSVMGVAGPGDIPVRRYPFTMPVRRATPVGPLPAAINRFAGAGSYAGGVLVAQPQLDMWASVRTWVLGTGVPRVSLVSMPETDRILPWRDVTATLVEVG